MSGTIGNLVLRWGEVEVVRHTRGLRDDSGGSIQSGGGATALVAGKAPDR